MTSATTALHVCTNDKSAVLTAVLDGIEHLVHNLCCGTAGLVLLRSGGVGGSSGQELLQSLLPAQPLSVV